MKSEEFLDKMDLIDEKLVQEATDFRASDSGRRKKIWISVLSAAAVLILAAGAVFGSGLIRKNRASKEERWETKYVSAEEATQGEELLVNKPWEEMTIPERYREFTWQYRTYSVRSVISPERAEEKLEEISLTGEHPFTGEVHETTAELFRFRQYDENAAVLIRFAESPDYYAAVCPLYQPATLGDYLRGINAEEALLVTGTAEYSYYDAENRFHRITFEGLTKESLLSYLAKYADVPAESLDEILRKDNANNISYMNCTVTEEEFRRQDSLFYAHFYFTETGYLWTNLMDLGPAFYIGEDAVREFEQYLKDNLPGYEYIETDTNQNKMPETAGEETVEE